ncbi:putative ABC transport system permease protein [Ruminococcus sp. YE71]|uniref:ABC transporter ATP-binding protein/permease n=1 Tax=unclassified Ruminococcus TaxID=2608920 RepID=UPI00088A3AA5|nr:MULTISPECIES: ABC transporter ATP-binding protein/permease [unclassified Ruminococcus]SDA26621.1 putative ABC transport system permease protein [Ruminococcus sp. YE78]SFW44312.1 putative ABC transport system permease protein [Ruminococcus sp. YE71]
MLQIKEIRKEYITGDLKQTALDSVSLNFRDNEFVAILGPSGSGKTTLLNIVGGLDRYDSGDLIINGISTKKYKDRDWDSYRNHTIGFVFQSYNLIPHQSVLSNVELALTISGISRAQRRERAKQALEKVGLAEHMHKRPNQMSGGQMQRVAIARALVNDPDILLADEPTGALDSETSLQVMDLLGEVAKDRLVIMVTHNPELAEKYATRTVKLKDGRITDDSDPFEVNDTELKEPEHKSMGKSSMSPVTSLGLSFNNLRTKKGRTLLTSFAGSIGIIGIALILSLSNGVNNYITDIQRKTMSSYPITIESSAMDYSSLINSEKSEMGIKSDEPDHDMDGVYVDNSSIEFGVEEALSISENNLSAFKKYLDDENSEINKYIGSNGIVYSYDTKFGVFTKDEDGVFVNCDGTTLDANAVPPITEISTSMFTNQYNWFGSYNFKQLIAGNDGSLVGSAITENYELVDGKYPESYDEIVLIMNARNEISSSDLYDLGILPTAEYRELMEKVDNGEEVTFDVKKLDYKDIIGKEYRLIPRCDMFVKNGEGKFDDINGDNARLEKLYDTGISLKITGIIKPKDSDTKLISSPVGYTKALTDYIISYTDNSEVVKAQKASKDINVLTGRYFSADSDEKKIADAKSFIQNMNTSDKASLYSIMTQYLNAEIPLGLGGLSGLKDSLPEDLGEGETDELDMAGAMETFLSDPDDEMLLKIYDMYLMESNYDDTLSLMGAVSLDAPSTIDIYVDDFESKDAVAKCISDYNNEADENDQIIYTDFIGLMMSSVTDIVNAISYVLISFVAVSLVVSSIMIGIITYISVLERTKEIGILRAIGASKHNISQVFNAETFIIGLCSGLIGIIITLLLLIPGNIIIHSVTEAEDMNASLPVLSAFVLIALSVILTLIGGFIPAKKAAKKDPVTALRTE